LFALFNAVFADASEFTETNRMPAQIHNLMKTTGPDFNRKLSAASEPDTQSFRHSVLIERQSFRLFELTPEKKGWSFWDNSNIKRLRKNTGASTTFLTQFEYDIYYPFFF